MNTLIVPYKLGYGKSGNALPSSKNYHALITETYSYPYIFNELEKFKHVQFKYANLDDWNKFSSTFDKHFLLEWLPNYNSDIFETDFPNGDKLVFVNIQKLRNSYKGLLSFKIEDLNLEIKLT